VRVYTLTFFMPIGFAIRDGNHAVPESNFAVRDGERAVPESNFVFRNEVGLIQDEPEVVKATTRWLRTNTK
jgi:hypothetical protein